MPPTQFDPVKPAGLVKVASAGPAAMPTDSTAVEAVARATKNRLQDLGNKTMASPDTEILLSNFPGATHGQTGLRTWYHINGGAIYQV